MSFAVKLSKSGVMTINPFTINTEHIDIFYRSKNAQKKVQPCVTRVTPNVRLFLHKFSDQIVFCGTCEFGSSISEITGGSGGSAKDIVASMKLTPKKYMLDKKDGSVKCKAEFEVNGMKTTKMLKISVVKKNDEWYISGISVIAE